MRANMEVEPFGMGFLSSPALMSQPRSVATPKSMVTDDVGNIEGEQPAHQFDVAISFAGPERPLAAHLARAVHDAGFRVFFDDLYPEQLWGKNLVEFFDNVYRKQSRYCVMFVSPEYRDRMWPTHERQSAQARALHEKGNDYILPILVDEGVELPGMPPTLGYLALAHYSMDTIAEMLTRKLQATVK